VLYAESRLLYPNVITQLETDSRSGTVRTLPYFEVDWDGRGLRWGWDKTKAGTRRTIPISQRAMAVLEVWAENFPNRQPEHYVFPQEIYRQPKERDRGKVSPYRTDPTKHFRSLQRSWDTALERAGWILAGRPESMEGWFPFSAAFTICGTPPYPA
jgi:integrase